MTLSERVKKALQDNPSCRDNDSTLCALIWDEDCKKLSKDFTTISAIEFMHLIDTGKISKQQSILRARRNANNKNSDTRGKSYKPQMKRTTVKREVPNVQNDVHGVLCCHSELLNIHENLHLIKFHTFSQKMRFREHPN